MRTGLTALDPDLACPGYVLYSGNGASDALYLSATHYSPRLPTMKKAPP